ncbi:MAG: tetratricopeptide repeat protein [Anaerolineales bacterium]|nr:tetratricopeptide repeat protein [Anaerolineales bacterium]
MSGLRIACLGNAAILLGDQALGGLGSDKARALLIYLAVEAQRVHRREHLAGLLWSDQAEDKALHSLRQALSNLRKALQDEAREVPYLLVSADGIQMNPASEFWVDARAFQDGVRKALEHHQRCEQGGCLNIRRLRQTINLYQGPFLDQFYLAGSPLFDEWATLQREHFSRQATEAFARMAEYHERRGEMTLAAQAAGRLAVIIPWEEAAHCEVMRLLALDGQWAAAQAQFAACRRYLSEQLGVDPAPETKEMYEAIRQLSTSREKKAHVLLSRRFPVARHYLPLQGTHFVGRERELDLLAERLADPDCRLLTLVGTGGVGKTRLALEEASEQVGLFADGVFFITLASVPEAALVAPTIADVVQFRFFSREALDAQLIHYLQEKRMLLVLDNFEHLVEAGELVGEIIKRCPGVKIVCTSRQPLNLYMEWVQDVGGLGYPGGREAVAAGEALSYSALALFDQTAQRIQAHFSLEKELEAASQICRMLEGLPLGVELAASWTRIHRCTEIVRQLEQGLDVVATTMRDLPERHRSLRAACAHSWNLLSGPEQQVFSKLAVFRGEFSAEAAGWTAEAGAEMLAGLVEKSLLRRGEAGQFSIHNVLMQFAEERLRERAEIYRQVHDLHCDYFLGLVERKGAQLYGTEQQQASQELDGNIQNIRAAWQWAVSQGKANQIRRAMDGLGVYYDMRSWFQEGDAVFRSAVQSLESEAEVDDGLRSLLGSLFLRQGMFVTRLSRFDEAGVLLERGLALLEHVEAKEEMAFGLSLQGRMLVDVGELDLARQHLEQGLVAIQGSQKRVVEAILLDALAGIERIRGNLEAAQKLSQRALMIYLKLGDAWGIAQANNSLGALSGTLGLYDEAERYFQQALAAFKLVGDRSGTARSLQNLSILAYIAEDFERARQLRLECLEICREIGFRWGIASTLKHLGDVEKSLGSLDEALAHYAESLKLSRESGDRKSTIYTLNSLGGLRIAQGDYPRAMEQYVEAFHLAMEIKIIPVALDVLTGMADALAGSGKAEQAVQWLSFVSQAEGLDQQTRNKAEGLLQKMASDFTPETFTILKDRGAALTLDEAEAQVGALIDARGG